MIASTGITTPRTRAPITYVIDYSQKYLDDDANIKAFQDAPPDLMHVGKSVPILHNWGPVPLICGENQYTGGPGHTLSREAIRLLTPAELEQRIERLKVYTKKWHEIGVPLLIPYSSFHTIAGDHQKREGFWNFYDHWENYIKWLGPKPKEDPFQWLMVDKEGQLVPGACGGYSPDYYAPLHRYRVCPEHPEWRKFQIRLTELIAEAGYDGVFPDNSSPENIICFCRYCREGLKKYAAGLSSWELKILGVKGEPARIDLMSDETPKELIRRYRIDITARYQRMVREAGRKVNLGFVVFPNVNSYATFMPISSACDFLMFESVYAPGCNSSDKPPDEQSAGPLYQAHIGQLLFTMHAPARSVLLDYEGRKDGREAVMELGLAECAAFSNGGTIATRGEPHFKYAGFFRRTKHLYEGFDTYADIALLYSYWGYNPDGMRHPPQEISPAADLADQQRLIKVLVDRTINKTDLQTLKTLILSGHSLEMKDAQINTIKTWVGAGGKLYVYRPDTMVNGRPVAATLPEAVKWEQGMSVPGMKPLINNAEEIMRGLRFSAFIHPDERRMILHALNYNVTREQTPAVVMTVKNVAVTLSLPRAITAKSVRMYDPDNPETIDLQFKNQNGQLMFVLPEVRIYKLIEIIP